MYDAINLGYSVNDLEPYIDGETMMVHYGQLYMNYLNNLNKLLQKYDFNFEIDKEMIATNINAFKDEDRSNILYNLGGVLNHELYFQNMSPSLNNKPMGSLKEAIDKKYGNFDNFKKEFIDHAKNIRGSGYVFLALNPEGELDIISLANQNSPYFFGWTPIMAMDVWEHAYFLKDKAEKEKYFNDFFEVINFPYINTLYEDNKKD